MPTFPTPTPVHVHLDLAAGDARITASDRDDTVVEVAPRDPSRPADVRAAEQTRVELADGRLVVKTPRHGLSLSRGWSVSVTVEVPAGSRVDGHTGVGDLRADGPLGEATFKTGAGAIRLGHVGPLKAISGAGDVSVDGVAGQALVVTGSGAVRLGAVGGNAVVKNSNGATTVGAVDGNLRVAASNGDVAVTSATGSLVAKTAHGSVRVGAVREGDVELRTGFGTIEVGIAEGTAARLDVRTNYGMVRQELEAAGTPPAAAPTVTLKARTAHGDITIRRAASQAAA